MGIISERTIRFGFSLRSVDQKNIHSNFFSATCDPEKPLILSLVFLGVGYFDARYFFTSKISGLCIFLGLQYEAQPLLDPPVKYTSSAPSSAPPGDDWQVERESTVKCKMFYKPLSCFLPATLLDNLNCHGDPLVQSKQNQHQNSQDYTKDNGCKRWERNCIQWKNVHHYTASHFQRARHLVHVVTWLLLVLYATHRSRCAHHWKGKG